MIKNGLNSLKRPPKLDILGSCLREVRLYKLHVDNLISSMQQKNTNLEMEGFAYYRKSPNCQNVYYPYFLSRASLIPMGKDFVRQANKIIFDFI